MFIDYLINVLLVAAGYWMMAVVLFVLGFIYVRKLHSDFWVALKVISGFLFLIGLFQGMFSSANTYKNTVDYSRYQDQTMIEQRRESQPSAPIEDRTRQPLTEAELQERAIDMRERVDLDAGN